MIEKRLVRSDGSNVWCKMTFSAFGQPDSRPKYLIVIIEDVSAAHKLSTELSHQAKHDALTGLINRREFEQQLQNLLNNTRDPESVHVLCFIDLDQFKLINDTCGHMAGDELLRETIETLRNNLRRGDVLARLGGDEFGLVFANCNMESALRVADKLRTALSGTHFYWEGGSFSVTASMGLVEIDNQSSDVFSLLKAADTACYLAKDHGRNCVKVYTETDSVLVAHRSEMEWIGRLRDAINEDRLKLHAQLITPLFGEHGLRYELLVRMLDEEGNIILPEKFLSAAERYNTANSLDRWVVSRSLHLLKDNQQHLEQLESGQSYSRQDFCEFVQDQLDRTGVPAHKLCFEITETAAMSNISDARQFMYILQQRGCKFALDDFGSGLSSYGYLRSLPVDLVKIDGTFVRNMLEDDVHLAMVRSINEVAKLMGKLTVAEFVESEEILRKLRTLDVDYAQGFAVHRPVDLGLLLHGEAIRTSS